MWERQPSGDAAGGGAASFVDGGAAASGRGGSGGGETERQPLVGLEEALDMPVGVTPKGSPLQLTWERRPFSASGEGAALVPAAGEAAGEAAGVAQQDQPYTRLPAVVLAPAGAADTAEGAEGMAMAGSGADCEYAAPDAQQQYTQLRSVWVTPPPPVASRRRGAGEKGHVEEVENAGQGEGE